MQIHNHVPRACHPQHQHPFRSPCASGSFRHHKTDLKPSSRLAIFHNLSPVLLQPPNHALHTFIRQHGRHSRRHRPDHVCPHPRVKCPPSFVPQNHPTPMHHPAVPRPIRSAVGITNPLLGCRETLAVMRCRDTVSVRLRRHVALLRLQTGPKDFMRVSGGGGANFRQESRDEDTSGVLPFVPGFRGGLAELEPGELLLEVFV